MTHRLSQSRTLLDQLRHGLVVSCQALPDEPMHGSEMMVRMALAAWQGGAAGIRANTPDDIGAIHAAVPLPLIGIYKDGNSGVYITPTMAHARAIAMAGADIVALDGTQRPRPNGEQLDDLIAGIHSELGKPVLADVSTVAEGLAAQAAGADLVSTTLSGYTSYTLLLDGPDLELVRELVLNLDVPVIAEGRMRTPSDVRMAMHVGAFAVVVGGAITRPQWITSQFALAVKEPVSDSVDTPRIPKSRPVNTDSGLVDG